jgi:hypothetical protein
LPFVYSGFVFCECVFVQVCCSVVCILVFLEFLFLCLYIFFWFWDTGRWIKSKNTLRLMLIHHRQKPTEVTSSWRCT